MIVSPHQTVEDDPRFVELVARISAAIVAEHQPRQLDLIHVDNWFDQEWLGFAGTYMGVGTGAGTQDWSSRTDGRS